MRRRDLAPKGPWVLGLLGLVPFYATLAGGQFADAPYDGVFTSMFFTYGAIILSFLGGTRWGFEIGARPEGPGFFTLFFAIMPCILALLAPTTRFINPFIGLGILGLGFVMMWLWDYSTSGGSTRRWPLWYATLRTTLTVGVLIALGLQFTFELNQL